MTSLNYDVKLTKFKLTCLPFDLIHVRGNERTNKNMMSGDSVVIPCCFLILLNQAIETIVSTRGLSRLIVLKGDSTEARIWHMKESYYQIAIMHILFFTRTNCTRTPNIRNGQEILAKLLKSLQISPPALCVGSLKKNYLPSPTSFTRVSFV